MNVDIKRYPMSPEAKCKTDEEIEDRLKNLKPAINEFLFGWVPGSMTIHEFEGLACGIFAAVHEEYEKRR